MYINKYKVTEIAIIVCSWVLALLLFAYLKFGDGNDAFLTEWYDKQLFFNKNIYTVALAYGLLLGSLLSIIHLYVYPRIIQTPSFTKNIIARSVSFLVCFKTAEILIGLFYNGLNDFHLSYSNPNSILRSLFLYAVIINFLTDFFLLMRKNLGPGYFFNLIRGKYYRPREENRIFMFLDLASSTTIAERIGHIAYSSLLQDCFRELTPLLLKNKASIYQYVGDEAVITWKINKHTNRELCLDLFFSFQQRLQEKKEDFWQKYHTTPFFRASINEGRIVMSTVGELKTEIVYHGDVLNTAARIQSLCKTYNSALLISENFYEKINDKKIFQFKCFNNIAITGKNEKINIYSVNRN
ncbi:adenylate/guanylate cyclase domain-containing protein [Zunongwangia endophytica]|uniref:Adenylate/guanylate cyclase domain-containing protein n=1 Tax=Zunongwangia endophytica TaxID=1808945 RepID=A0ABV8HGD5_9FLAO|nr:adenylate/guanylate cyclase domain-containing protein [Zunongwangia endophytica]MDN3596873.1 adenylate/guanylate cyclase domain-containing protein [Zunongwangia endophytica]